MNIQKILCVLMALLLAFTIVAQPLEVKAVDPVTVGLVGVPLILGIGTVMIGLGLTPGANSGAFNELANTIGSALSASWKFTSAAGTAMLKLVCLGNKYYVAQEVVDFVLSMIHSSGIVNDVFKSDVPSSSPAVYSTILENAYKRIGLSAPYYIITNDPFISSSGEEYYTYKVYFCNSASLHDLESYSKVYPNWILTFKSSGALYGASEYANGMETYCSSISSRLLLKGTLTTVYDSDLYGVDGLADSMDDEKYKTWVQDPIISVDFGIGFEPDPEDPSDPTDPTDPPPNIPWIPIHVPGNPDEFPDTTPDEVREGDESNPDGEEDAGEDVDLDPGTIPDDVTFPTEPPPTFAPDEGDSGGSGTGSDVSTNYTTWFQKIIDWFDKHFTRIDTGFSNFEQWWNELLQAIPNGIQQIGNWFSEQWDLFEGWFAQIGQWLADLGQTLLDGIREIFVPSEDFLTEKWDSLRERFSFVDNILVTFDAMKAGLTSGGSGVAPVIYIHLGNSEGSLNWGGTVKFLDLTWYSRYKASGDAILSGFLWACFLWRVFMKLPGIINGVSGAAGFVLKSSKENEE